MANISFGADKVIVIDALCATDTQTARRLYENILDYLNHSKSALSCKYYRCNSSSDFIKVLDELYERVIHQGEVPLIHIEGHGEKECFKLPDKLYIQWSVIFERFRKINIATRNNLFVLLGACEAAFAFKAATITRECPVYGLFAPEKIVTAGEVEDGFVAFYSGLIIDNDINIALNKFADKINSNNFALLLSQLLFEKAAFKYITQNCMGVGRDIRQEELTTIARNNTGLPLKAIRKQLKQELFASQADSLQKLYDRFMMIDKFPENAERFDFDIAHFEADVRNKRLEI